MSKSPTTAAEVAKIVNAATHVTAVGGRSKWTFPAADTVTEIDLSQLSGIVAYAPDEYTFTAKANTPLVEIINTLAARQQYLPFDPLLANAGATLGGTVACNTSGSGRLRYGGVRDFILGVRFVDGNGNVLRGGGNVVKNASGFDLPKFMVGSLGRYGIMTEITMKVFPKPAAFGTLVLQFESVAAALQASFALANQPFELDAFDFRHTNGSTTAWIRLGGLPNTLQPRLTRLQTWLQTHTSVQTIDTLLEDAAHWQGINALAFAADSPNVVKIPLPPRKLLRLDEDPAIDLAHYYCAGNVALVTTTDITALGSALTRLGLNGLLLRGTATNPQLGTRHWLPFAQRIKTALDPHQKFLEI